MIRKYRTCGVCVCVCNTIEMWKLYVYLIRFRKTDHFTTTNEKHLLLHIIDMYVHSYTIKVQWWNNKRRPDLLFHTAFSWPCKTLRSQYRWCGTSWGGGGLIGWHGSEHLLHVSFIFCCGLWLVWWLVWHMAWSQGLLWVSFSCWISVTATHPPSYKCHLEL